MLYDAVKQNKFVMATQYTLPVTEIWLYEIKNMFYIEAQVLQCCSLKLMWVWRLTGLPEPRLAGETNPLNKPEKMGENRRLIFSRTMQEIERIEFG